MAIDLTGGIDPARRVHVRRTARGSRDAGFGELLGFDDRGQVGLPRIGIEAVAANWAEHSVQANVAFPDGRVYRLREDAASWPVEGPDGKPTVLGGGPLAFTCVKPFRRLDDDVRREGGPDVLGRSHRRPQGGAAGRPRLRGRRRRSPCRRGCRARCGPTPPPGWNTSVEGDLMGGGPLRATVPGDGRGAGGRRRARLHRGPACGSGARGAQARGILGALLAVGALPQRAGLRLHRLPPAPTASPPSTRATCSTATATSCRPASSRHPG